MTLQSLSAAAFAISIFLVSAPADARPVTAADVAGKMICWNGGDVQAFSADGKTAQSNKFADGKWSVGADGVRIEFAGTSANVDIEIQPDGTFTFEATNGGVPQKGAGKICQGKFITSTDGEAIYYPNNEGVLSSYEWKYTKYDKIFKGVTQEDLDDGGVLYVGEWPGADYGVSAGEYCN